MLTKETKSKLKALGFDVAKLEAAIKDEEETSFDVPEITSYTDEELSARDENAKKAGIKEGKDAGKGIVLKEIAKKLGIEGEFKEPDALTEAIGKNGKGDTNEQVKLLQKRAEDAESARDAALNETKSAKRDAELLSNLPANRKSDLTDSEYLQLFKLSHQVIEEDGKTVVKKGDTVLRDDKTQSPLALKDAIHNMFNERKFISEGSQQQQQGRGGSDKQAGGGSGIKTYTAAEAQWAKENPDKPLMGGEFQAYVGQLAKEPGFNINA